jgi:predicted O-methyltransferase YrrM
MDRASVRAPGSEDSVINFEAALNIAHRIPQAAESRPEFLLSLRDATHPTCLYYRFFHELAFLYSPFNTIEIGTYTGTSAAHFAWGNGGEVITIDINPDAKRCVDELMIPNVRSIIADSMTALTRIQPDALASVLYIDGWHDFNRAYQEYIGYRKLVRNGGVILIDDAGLEMDGDEMNVFWGMISEPKERVDWLHPNVGFGIVEKRDGITPLPFEEAARLAAPVIHSRRK